MMMPVVMMPVMIVRGLRSSANSHNYYGRERDSKEPNVS
jgi:hypothetical protein